MVRQRIGWMLSLVLIMGVAPAALAGTDGPSPQDRAVARALAHLPRRPIQVVVIDANAVKPEIREKLLGLEAFTMDRSKVVYLVEQSIVLQEATRGSPFYECMLASIIWHEMAHLDGADERVARRAEEKLWMRFLLNRIVDREDALHYLNALVKRPPVDAVAIHELRDARR